MRSLGIAIAAGLVFCLVGTAARADSVKLSATLAPVVTTIKSGKGTADVTVDTEAKTANWTITYTDIKAPAMGAFMIPGTKPSDNPTPLMITLPANPTSPLSGSTPLSDPQVAGIQSGAWWIMLGSKDGPEIGGELKKAP